MSKIEKDHMKIRKGIEESVKDSLMVQMSELQQWGIMTDWRYSYFTLQPSYQAMVLRSFADLIEQGLIQWGDRPVLWSRGSKRVLAEEDIQ